MEYIKNIKIKNFKSIRHQVIDGCKRINVFIGYPNVGKSNLLEALSLFCITPEIKFTDLIRVKEDPTLFFNGFVTNAIEVTLNNYYQACCTYLKGELQVVEKELEDNGNGRFPIVKENWFKSFTFKSAITHQTIPSRKEIKKYEFKKDSQKVTTQYSVLDMPFGGNVFNILQTNETLYEDVAPLFKKYDLELLYDSALQAFKILKRTNKGIFTVPYELLADTLQRLIFYNAAILSNKETILLFEEPEAHMFPPYIKRFTTDVIYDKTNQFFIATHSPYVLDAFLEDTPDDLSIYLVYYEKGETKIKLMHQKDIDEVREYGVDLFFNLESYLKHGQVNND